MKGSHYFTATAWPALEKVLVELTTTKGKGKLHIRMCNFNTKLHIRMCSYCFYCIFER